MNSSQPTIEPRPAICPRCGAAFGCGVDTACCWCTRLPSIDPARLAALDPVARASLGLPADARSADCLCPDCLALLVDALAKRREHPARR